MNMNVASYRTSAKSLWSVLFHFKGSVIFSVLPFCILNCLLLAGVEYLEDKNLTIGFSPNGHGLMTLLVSFLVISKVNLSYDRFKAARECAGNACLHLRELNQLILTFTDNLDDEEDKNATAEWQAQGATQIIELMQQMKTVIQDDRVAGYLARHEVDRLPALMKVIDPLSLVQALRLHLYSADSLQLLERVTLLSKLNEFVSDYRHLLSMASSPLPFALVQMGRTFLFLWTFSMPLVLRQGPFSDIWTAMLFLFFLTYGFIGLEIVSMKLANPFGDSLHDIQVTKLTEAAIIGIQEDSQHASLNSTSQRRLFFRKQRDRRTQDAGGQGDVADVRSSYHVMSDMSHFPPI